MLRLPRGAQVRASHELCTARLRDLIRLPANASLYKQAADTQHGALHAFQRELSSQYLAGAYALSNGYLLSATILSAMLVHIIDGKFNRSAFWLLLAAFFSFLGPPIAPMPSPALAFFSFVGPASLSPPHQWPAA